MPEEQTFVPPGPLHTAVLFLIYKRPDTTKQVFEAIRQAKPPRLYVAADGPKPDAPGEAEKVQQVRDIVLNGVDWDCEVKTLFRDTNLGCKYGVSGGIDWFFEHEEEGIILEDDTLPSQSFFWFCQDILAKFEKDKRIGLVSGINYYLTYNRRSYHFSKHGFIWGWATWREVWQKYSKEIRLPNNIKLFILLYGHFNNFFQVITWWVNLKLVERKSIDTWDFQFAYTRIINNYLTIRPNKNLVENIGFGSLDATHTQTNRDDIKNIKEEILFPLCHAELNKENFQSDKKLEKNIGKLKIVKKFAKYFTTRY